MMIDKRLIGTVPESKRYIVGNVAAQWLSLTANIILMYALTQFLAALLTQSASPQLWTKTLIIALLAVAAKHILALLSARFSYLSGRTVKLKLRHLIYEKLLHLGSAYRDAVQTSEVVQVAVEGVEQLETYFGSYLPQFFYSMLAPLTLFAVLSAVSLPAAAALLVCVPLIPISIAAVQTWAKKLLSKYWDQYTGLGDTFLENLQGLTTLKIYQADEMKRQQMNEEAEKFRKITMKVLTMQLNSITIMDLVAYGGAALGVILAVIQMNRGRVDLAGCLLIILLSADFFLPMRLLGSFFHIAMNGMAASDKIFRLLDLLESTEKNASIGEDFTITAEHLNFAYDESRPILKDVSLSFPAGSFTAIVGESGCGKSTLAGLLMGRNKGYQGTLNVGSTPLRELSEESLMDHFTYISHQSHLFKGTVRENLRMGDPHADEAKMNAVLKQVNLYDFLESEQGLETPLSENGGNLSGGQRQRLALARAILHDSPLYIFDEATSNIDVESENDIMEQIHALAKEKTVILISHRLANVVDADNIYVLDRGTVVESGTHRQLLDQSGAYQTLWTAQQELEEYRKERNA